MNHPLSRIGLALALCSTLAFTACDDDDDNPTTPSSPAPVEPSPTPTPAPTPAPTPVPDPGNQPGQSTSFLGKLKTNTPPLLRIGGLDVMVDENTTYNRSGSAITLADIQIGEVVRVHGNFTEDGRTVLATRINVPPPESVDDTP